MPFELSSRRRRDKTQKRTRPTRYGRQCERRLGQVAHSDDEEDDVNEDADDDDDEDDDEDQDADEDNHDDHHQFHDNDENDDDDEDQYGATNRRQL